MRDLSNPNLRFKREDRTEFPDWREKTIKEIAPLQRGFDLPEKERVNGEYPVVCSNGIVAYHNQYKCEGYAVITGRSGTIGNFTYLDKCRYWAHNTSLWVTDFCGNNPKFIYYFYHTVRIEQYSTGTGVPTLNRNNVHASRHYIPCLEEQKKIADFLSTVDEVIAQSEAEVKNLEQQKKGVMHKIFSQEVRFKREDGTEFPAWKFVRIDEMAEINPKSSAIPERFFYVDLGSVSMGLWQEQVVISKENAPSRANRLANCGDVFFQSVRPYNMGHYYLSQEFDLPVVASTGFIQLRARKGYCNAYIYQILYEDRFNAEVNIRCTGSNYPAINRESFSDIEIMSPCLEEQQKIADFLSAYDEAITYAKQELEKWKELKKGLLQQMFV